MADIFTLGIDLGSATSKCVVLKNGTEVVGRAIIDAGTGTTGPQRAFEAGLADAGITADQVSNITSTGYGRNSFEKADFTNSGTICCICIAFGTNKEICIACFGNKHTCSLE